LLITLSHYIGDKSFVVLISNCNYHNFGNRRVVTQTRFDLSEFDSESTDLDLMVVAAKIYQAAIWEESSQISSLVHPSIRSVRKWIRNEPLGRQCRPVQISTGDSGSTHMKFAYSSNWYRLVVLV
jgi:hypothetical protein